MIKNQFKKMPLLFSGALICGVLMLTVYALKGIWPFGAGNVTYDDMAQGTLPIYYHLYDWLHGDKAMAFDWYTGLGSNIVNSGTFMPLDLVLCLFSRDKLLYGIGILVIVKVAASAATAKYVFDKLFGGVHQIWRVLFSVIYAMSSYSMFYYTNAFWLDFVIIFPLVFYGLKRLLADNKPLVFVLFYAYTLYLSVYIGFMVTLGIFFLSGLYILLLCKKENRGKRTCLLGISTVTGALLSAWHSVPMAIQTLSSKRLETSFDDAEKSSPLLEILSTEHLGSLSSKAILALGLQIAFVFVLIMIFKSIKEKKFKNAAFVFSTVLIFFLPVVFENTNLFWHGGSYVRFPARFFFISVFVLLVLALASIDRYGELLKAPRSKIFRVLSVPAIVILSAGFIFGVIFFANKAMGTLGKEEVLSLVLALSFAVLYATGIPLFALLLCRKKYTARVFCFTLCIIQMFGVCYAGIANTHQKAKQDMLYNSASYIGYCNEVSQLELDCGELGRIKNPDTSLNSNYPFILQIPALSNWTHNIPKYVQDAASVLGQSIQYTRLLDSGGTAFTDGLFSIKKAVVRNHIKLDNQYKKIDSTENFTLYENSYALDIGLLGDSELLNDITSVKAYDRFKVQNNLYSSFSGSEEPLFYTCSNKGETAQRLSLAKNDEREMIFTYTAGKNEVLYINTADFIKKSFTITVDGEPVLAPYYKQTKYSYYPSEAVNGTLSLGSFDEGKTVEIRIFMSGKDVITNETVQLAYMSLDKLTQLNSIYSGTVTDISTEKRSFSLDYNNTHGKGRYLFIPVTYDAGWECEINGEEAEIKNALGAYIAVELPEGSGTIEFSHTTPGLKAGIIISFAGILAAGIMLLMKKKEYSVPKIIATPVLVLFVAAFSGAVILMYAVSAVFFVIYAIKIIML